MACVVGVATTACVRTWDSTGTAQGTGDASVSAGTATGAAASAPAGGITLRATPDHGGAPLQVAFSTTIPAGVGTGCEAYEYDFGNGDRQDYYTPCADVVPSIAPGSAGTPFVPPTAPPRAAPDASSMTYTYARPGTYRAQFFLRTKPADTIVGDIESCNSNRNVVAPSRSNRLKPERTSTLARAPGPWHHRLTGSRPDTRG
jgi:hypothetical protein